MANENMSDAQRELHEANGALKVLFELREEFAQWVEEAQDDSKHEALENVLGHIEAMEGEYRSRHAEMMAKR